MPQVRLTAPDVDPISVQEVKDHLRKGGTSLDTLLLSYIKGVTSRVESEFRIQLVRAQWKYTISKVVQGMDLPLPVVDHSTVEVKYFDSNDQEQTLSTGSYELVKHRLTSKIYWNNDLYLNLSRNKMYPISITFFAGYPVEDGIAKIPDDVKVYLKTLIGHVFVSPEGLADSRFDNVMNNYRSFLGDHIRRYLP
jgi:uncharacterized phiE125 gp8 family phage protein